jgi:AraC-like DNA-binding protein
MGKSFHAVHQLEPPLREVQDRVTFVARDEEMVVNNQGFKVVMILDGRMRLRIDGKLIGEVGPGDILIVPGPCQQRYRSLERRLETRVHAFLIHLDQSQFSLDTRNWPEAISRQHAEVDFTVCLQHYLGRLRHLPKGQTPSMQEVIKTMRAESERAEWGFRHRVNAHARLLVTLVATEIARQELSQPPESPPTRPPREKWVVDQVRDYLVAHHAEPLNLDTIARHLRLSGEHLARVFKRATGGTIFDYLDQLRLEQARVYLASTRLTIGDVARAVGYSSATLFCRKFKRATTQTPLAYRLQSATGSEFSPTLVHPTD